MKNIFKMMLLLSLMIMSYSVQAAWDEPEYYDSDSEDEYSTEHLMKDPDLTKYGYTHSDFESSSDSSDDRSSVHRPRSYRDGKVDGKRHRRNLHRRNNSGSENEASEIESERSNSKFQRKQSEYYKKNKGNVKIRNVESSTSSFKPRPARLKARPGHSYEDFLKSKAERPQNIRGHLPPRYQERTQTVHSQDLPPSYEESTRQNKDLPPSYEEATRRK